MTKILNFALKVKEVVVVGGGVAHAKSSDPATPPQNFKRALRPLPSSSSICAFTLYSSL